MAQRSKADECPQFHQWLCSVRRWLFSMRRCLLNRSGYLLFTVTLVGLLVIWINVSFSSRVFDKRDLPGPMESMYPYIAEDRLTIKEISPAERERQRRVAIFARILHKQLRKQMRKKSGNQTQCIHPKLDLKHDTNNFAYFDLPPLNCTGSGMFYSRGDVLVLNTSVIASPSLLDECDFYPINRVNDDVYSYASPETRKPPSLDIRFPHDFVRIRCALKSSVMENQELLDKADVRPDPAADEKGSDELDKFYRRRLLNDYDNETKQNYPLSEEEEEEYNWKTYFMGEEEFIDPEASYGDYDQFLVQVNPKPEVFQRIAKIEAASRGQSAMKLNVLMFALDSMSHLSYQRKLPRTYQFLKEELGAAILENYNIVGDATTAAIIPMLTGHTEADLPEVRVSKLDGGMVDEYPIVWKNFTDRGYATFFAEDEPTLSTFNLRLNGFRDAPTDHYMRTFWVALWDSSLRQNSERFCTGDTAHHRFMLKYLEEFFVKYGNVSRFAFGFHGELSHGDNNPAQYVDGELLGFLQRLRQRKILEDTVLIMFGDHGARYSKVRSTVQGKLEERLPLMSFVFPAKFRKRYPQLYGNLLTNTQRLSTPFDIYETLLDILDPSRPAEPAPGSPGLSLLREIPAERTCKEAGIGMHWCTCMHTVRVDPGEEFVGPAAEALMWHLNAQVEPHRHHCAQLKLKEVLSVQMVIPNERVLRYKHSRDSDQREANFTKEIDLDVVHYQFQVDTNPCGAIYEATVMADFRNFTDYRYSVTPGISRINKYGAQPKCVQDRYPLLRKFCCCFDYLKGQQRDLFGEEGVELAGGNSQKRGSSNSSSDGRRERRKSNGT